MEKKAKPYQFRAIAQKNIKNYEHALQDIKQAMNLDSADKAIKEEYQTILKAKKEFDKVEGKYMSDIRISHDEDSKDYN